MDTIMLKYNMKVCV